MWQDISLKILKFIHQTVVVKTLFAEDERDTGAGCLLCAKTEK